MGQDYLSTNYNGLSNGEFIFHVTTQAVIIDGHAYFTGPCPDYVSGASTLTALAEQLAAADRAAAGRDTNKLAEMKAIRADLEQRMDFNANHIVMLALTRKEPEQIHTFGYEPKQKSLHRIAKVAFPEKVKKITAKNGAVSGTAIISINRPTLFGSIELQICDGEPGDESSWRMVDIFYKCRMELKDLEPVKRYYFRARYKNAAGTGPWSEIVSLVVV